MKQWIRAAVEDGRLSVDDVTIAGKHLYSLIKGATFSPVIARYGRVPRIKSAGAAHQLHRDVSRPLPRGTLASSHPAPRLPQVVIRLHVHPHFSRGAQLLLQEDGE